MLDSDWRREQTLACAEIQKTCGAPCAALRGALQIEEQIDGGVFIVQHIERERDGRQDDGQLIVEIMRNCRGHRVGTVGLGEALHNSRVACES